MGYLNKFGFKIYRLKELKEADEFLIYNINTCSYNQYGYKRLLSILQKTLLGMEINFKDFVKQIMGDGYKKINLNQFLDGVVNEEYELIDNISYKPEDTLLFIENDKTYFNIYKKSKLLLEDVSQYDNFDNINSLILNLVGDEEEEYLYFCKWLAWKIQNPLKRLPTAIIFQGEQGTGKTKFCELVLKPIFENSFCEIGQANINQEYNDYMVGKEIIVANEVIHNDNKYLVPDKLKNYVTDEYISINRKFKDTTYQKNYSQWIFVTNNKVPIKIDKGDRRYTVFKSKKLINGKKLITDLINNHDNEIRGFLNYLLNLDVILEEVLEPLHNAAKDDIIKYSNSSIDDFLDELKEFDELDFLSRFDKTIVYDFKAFENGVLVPTSKLYKCYCEYCLDYKCRNQSRQLFTRYLKGLSFDDKILPNNDGKTTRYILFKNGWQDNIK